MSGTRSASQGAAALKTVRSRKGLTQAELSERSGITVRSIRLLESGQVDRPRISTLTGLAHAAGLTKPEAEAFFRAWRGQDQFATFAELITGDADIEAILAEASLGNGGASRIVSVSYRAVVQARQLAEIWVEQIVEARVDGLATMCHIVNGDDSTDAAAETFEALAGCELLDSLSVPAHNLRVYQVGFGDPLAKGERRFLRFRRTAGHSDRKLVDSDGVAMGGLNRLAHVQAVVEFADERPVHSWEVEFTANSAGFQRLRPLTVDSMGGAHIMRINVPPGSYGIEWEWRDG